MKTFRFYGVVSILIIYGLFFVFITGCEFDNTESEITAVEWLCVSDKQNVQKNHKPHQFLNIQRCCQNCIIGNCCQPVFQFQVSGCNKIAALVGQ